MTSSKPNLAEQDLAGAIRLLQRCYMDVDALQVGFNFHMPKSLCDARLFLRGKCGSRALTKLETSLVMELALMPSDPPTEPG